MHYHIAIITIVTILVNQVLETLEVDFIDESEVLTPADEHNHVWKHDFKIPFVCGCRNLGEALRRIAEGAALIRTKGEAGSGNIVEAVRHMRTIMTDIKRVTRLDKEEIVAEDIHEGKRSLMVVHSYFYGWKGDRLLEILD